MPKRPESRQQEAGQNPAWMAFWAIVSQEAQRVRALAALGDAEGDPR